MAIAFELSLSNSVYFGKYTAQSSGTFGIVDLSSTLVSIGGSPIENLEMLDSTSKMTHGFNTYYKMQGFNPSTQQFENWHCQGTPLMVAPSGNTLVDVCIVSAWQDR